MEDNVINNLKKEFLVISSIVLNEDYSNYRNLSFINNYKYLLFSSKSFLFENNKIIDKEYEAVKNCFYILNIYINIDNYKSDKEISNKVNELKKCLVELKRSKTTDLFSKQNKNLYIEISFLSLSNLYLKLNEIDKTNEILVSGYKKKYFYCFYNYILDSCEDLFSNSINIIYSFIYDLSSYINKDFLNKYIKNNNNNNKNKINNLNYTYANKLANLINKVSRYLKDNELNEEYDYFNKTIRSILKDNNIRLDIHPFETRKEEDIKKFNFQILKEDQYKELEEQYKELEKFTLSNNISLMSNNIKIFLNLALELKNLIDKEIIISKDYSFALNPIFKAIEYLLSELISGRFFAFIKFLYDIKGIKNYKERDSIEKFFNDKKRKEFVRKNKYNLVDCTIGDFLYLFGMYDSLEDKWYANNIIKGFINKYKVYFNEDNVNCLLNIINRLKKIRNKVSHRNIVSEEKYYETYDILIKETPKFFNLIYNYFYLDLLK